MNKNYIPVVMCIGSDRVAGDMLGPKVGELLIGRNIGAYVYGRMGRAVNGDNIEDYYEFIKERHRGSVIIAVDACLGKVSEVGRVMYTMSGIGAGFAIRDGGRRYGDIGIVGIVAESGEDNLKRLTAVRPDSVEKMAGKITEYITNNMREIIAKVQYKYCLLL